jgi:hypothetical protein
MLLVIVRIMQSASDMFMAEAKGVLRWGRGSLRLTWFESGGG